MTEKIELAEGQVFVEGRSEAKARELLAAATAKGVENEVFTTSFGYLVPEAILTDKVEDKVEDIDEEEKAAAAEAAAARQAEIDEAMPFDPSAATVTEVQEYLAGADVAERDRVLAEEKAGKNRVSIVGSDEEGAK